MGFAIPTQIAEPTVNKLIRFGKITHGFIGVQISDVTPDNAKFFASPLNFQNAVVKQGVSTQEITALPWEVAGAQR